jgi:hypothetical protein
MSTLTDASLTALVAIKQQFGEAAYQDFMRVINSSPKFQDQVNTFFGTDRLGTISIGVTAGGAAEYKRDQNDSTVGGLNNSRGLITFGPTSEQYQRAKDDGWSVGYGLAESFAHELGHAFDPGIGDAAQQSAGATGGTIGKTVLWVRSEAYAELNSLDLMTEARQNLRNDFSDDPTALPFKTGSQITGFPRGEDAVKKLLGSTAADQLAQTCSASEACVSILTGIMGKFPYGYYDRYYQELTGNPSATFPAQQIVLGDHGDFDVVTDPTDPDRLNVVDRESGQLIQSVSTSSLSDGSVAVRIDQYYGDGSIYQSSTTVSEADGSLTTTTSEGDGNTIYTTNSRTFDDGSKTDSTTYPDGSTETHTYEIGGRLASESWHDPDGSYGSSAYNIDGSSATTTYDAETGVNGYKVVTADGSETDYRTIYDADGGYQQSWTASDGSHGENDLSAGGVTLTSRTEADGSASWSSSDGGYGTTVLNADGTFTGSDHASDGTLTTRNYDEYRTLLGDSWSRPDGAYGSDTYGWGGTLESGEAHFADGSHDVITQDYGHRETLHYAAAGELLTDTVSDTSGESSHTVVDSYTYNSDGSMATDTTTNSNGDSGLTTYEYDAGGKLAGLEKDQTQADGSYETLHTAYGYDANGEIVTRQDQTFTSDDGQHATHDYSVSHDPENGDQFTEVSSSWQNADGSHGQMFDNADGSKYGDNFGADGAYNTWVSDSGGYLTTNYYAQDASWIQQNAFLTDGSEQITRADGTMTNIVTTHGWLETTDAKTYAADGFLMSEVVSHFDDSYSDQTTTSYARDGSYVSDFQKPDGNTHTTFDAAANDLKTTWTELDGDWSSTEIITSGDVQTTQILSSDGSSDFKVLDDGHLIVDNSYDSGTGDHYDYTASYAADGSYETHWTNTNGSHGADTFNADTGISTGEATNYNSDGGWSAVQTTQIPGAEFDRSTQSSDGSWMTDHKLFTDANGSYNETVTNSDGTVSYDQDNALTGYHQSITQYGNGESGGYSHDPSALYLNVSYLNHVDGSSDSWGWGGVDNLRFNTETDSDGSWVNEVQTGRGAGSGSSYTDQWQYSDGASTLYSYSGDTGLYTDVVTYGNGEIETYSSADPGDLSGYLGAPGNMEDPGYQPQA